MKPIKLAVWIVLAALALTACVTSVKRVSAKEGAAYAAEVDEYVESWLVGLSVCDFDMHTRGVDPDWIEKQRKEGTWQQECEAKLTVSGVYKSKTLDHVEDRQYLRVVIYHLKFENNPDASLSMYFYRDDPEHLIVGVELMR